MVAQFLGTSLWFVGNVVLPQHPVFTTADESIIGFALSAVQLGFIFGTLIIALFNLADRIKSSLLFFLSCTFGSLMNLLLLNENLDVDWLVASRFFVGLALAGIYPVGIKIVSDHYQEGLGKALGYLVGALVLGTALPHFLSVLDVAFDFRFVTITTSCAAFLGGLSVLLFVPKGPFEKRPPKFKIRKILTVFKNKPLFRAALGYFGHMWELYAFWGFVPFFVSKYFNVAIQNDSVAWISFLTIGAGTLSCIIAGNLSGKWGSYKTARFNLTISGVLCLLSPLFFLLSPSVFIGLMLIWGAVVVADSAQFSTLVAMGSASENRGTAITLVNCIGFAITVVSIQLLALLVDYIPANCIFLVLAVGPLCGILLSREK